MAKWRTLQTGKLDPIWRTKAGYVYVYRHPDGRYKIGETSKPAKRDGVLRGEFGAMELVRLFPTLERKATEAHFHRLFWRKHLDREWFALDSNDLALFDRQAKMLAKVYEELEPGYAV